MYDLIAILIGLVLVMVLVLSPGFKNNKTEKKENNPVKKGDVSQEKKPCASLPGPDQIYSEARDKALPSDETLLKLRGIARDFIEQIRAEIRLHGAKYNFQVRVQEELSQKDERVLKEILYDSGWDLTRRNRLIYSISHSHYGDSYNRKDESILNHSELARQVEEELRGTMTASELAKGRNLAVDMVRQAAEIYRKTGQLREYRVNIDKSTHWLNRKDALYLLQELGWSVYAESDWSFRLSTDDYRIRTEPENDLPSPRSMKERILEEIREAMTEEEKALGRKLAVEAIQGAYEKYLASGPLLQYWFRISRSIHWLVIEDTKALLEGSDWRFFKEGAESYRIEADSWRTDLECPEDLPSPSQVTRRAEDASRSSWTEEEKEKAIDTACLVIEYIRSQLKEDELKYEFYFPLSEELPWLIQQDLVRFLDQAGWHAYANGNLMLRVSRKNTGWLFF